MTEAKIRKVMIATPAYSWSVDVRYVDSLLNTLRLAPSNVQIFPVFQPGDSLVQRARNDLVSIAIEVGVDDVVFIDADTIWTPEAFYRLLSHDVDFVGGIVPQKSEQPTATVRLIESKKQNKDGLLEVSGIGMGFTRMSMKCLTALWKSSLRYTNGDKKEHRAVFEVDIEHGELVGEDISACHKWIKHKGKVYADLAIVCGHSEGRKVYTLRQRQVATPDGQLSTEGTNINGG